MKIMERRKHKSSNAYLDDLFINKWIYTGLLVLQTSYTLNNQSERPDFAQNFLINDHLFSAQNVMWLIIMRWSLKTKV